MTASVRILGTLLCAGLLLPINPAMADAVPDLALLWLPGPVAMVPPGPVLVSLPPGWTAGDAMVVLLADPPLAPARRARLTLALIAEGAAVVHLGPLARPASPPAGEAPPIEDPGLRRELERVVQTLAVEWTDGLVVAVGHGRGVGVVLAAARDAGRSGEMPSLAAAVGLSPDGLAFQAGRAPPAAQEWALRARELCRVLTSVEQADPATERRCRALLVGAAEPGH